ncbi:Membrane-associated phospholipid phosphatase [Helicobacter heilmannii]|uniref:phosphatase PAP2 family protein n=1 Tax=Helicobacter heilmannii TaxID=35817 RepID=UPI0006A069CA|nr:phosphatase PAP2 family protein [Helicobacter heilmannii]CRF50971.1 Membrane-associated phospholipid phosphatase [Helicobacter heilmannii]
MATPYGGLMGARGRQKSTVKLLWILGIIFFMLLGLDTLGVVQKQDWIQSLDAFFIDVIRTPAPTQGVWLKFVLFSTWFAQSRLTTPIALLIAVWWVWRKQTVLGVWFFSTILVGEVALKSLKHLVARPRPFTNGEVCLAHGFSFPSGHALAATLFYGSLAFLLCSSRASAGVKAGGFVLLFLWIFLMMYDRVYLGVHYPTDVLGGFCLGLGFVCCSMGFYLGSLKQNGRS